MSSGKLFFFTNMADGPGEDLDFIQINVLKIITS